MPRGVIIPHAVQQAWGASGAISLDLSNKPFTITELWIGLRASITTTSATNYNDMWDRIISRLNLTGSGKTFFDVSNMRAAYHMARLGGFGTRRPAIPGDNKTTLLQQIWYCFHFGVAPFKIDPRTGRLYYDRFDLTAGIPPQGAGNLSLGGSFGAANAMGGNVTIVDADLDVYLVGVQAAEGESQALIQPAAIPVWAMQTPTPTATSSALATPYNIPGGDFLHSILVMTTNGSNDPRDDSVLNSIELYDQKHNRSIVKYGGQAGAVADVKIGEIMSQHGKLAVYPSDDVSTAMTLIASGGTPSVPTVSGGPSDAGLYLFEMDELTRVMGGSPYGADLRNANTGDLQLRYGVSDASGVAMHALLRKYQMLGAA